MRAALQRLRAELDKVLEEVLASAHTEVEAHAAERRRALHELDERMRRRERELMERLQREEAEAAQRIKRGLRRRSNAGRSSTSNASSSARPRGYSEDAAQQFAALVKSSREDAAQRLSRELDRAVEVFAREAEAVLAERLAHVGDAGAQRLERRLDDATRARAPAGRAARCARRADRRVEADIRERLEELGADADAERAVHRSAAAGARTPPGFAGALAEQPSAPITPNVLRPTNTWRVRRREDEPTRSHERNDRSRRT